jgi:hypothetical protein
MVFIVKVEIKDASVKYGFLCKGVFAAEHIKKGQVIKICDDSCDFDLENGFSREKMLEILKNYSEISDFLHNYSFMYDDDRYDLPKNWNTNQKLECECVFFNHSCEPNCAFLDERYVAIKDIQQGDELTHDYQTVETEAGLHSILCRCGSRSCCGLLKFDCYRNVDWQKKNYKNCKQLVKKRIDELRTKWFSSRCFLKFYEENKLGLTSLLAIKKNELVAKYSTDVKESSHYIRQSVEPTCFLDGDEVYAIRDLEPNTELCIDFQK